MFADARQQLDELSVVHHQLVVVVAKQGRGVVLGFGIQRDGKKVDAKTPRFVDGLAGVVQTIVVFVVVDVVRLAVRDQ